MSNNVVAATANALVVAGLPLESAEKFADVAVDAVRQYLLSTFPCECGTSWTEHGLLDPQCGIHGRELQLGGDGHGGRLTPEDEREQLIANAVRLQHLYGEDTYRRFFAPLYAEILATRNTQDFA